MRGVPHRFMMAGTPPSFDGQRLLRDTQKICEAAARLWHGARGKPPQPHYLFMLNATPGGYGGLEHRCCTALRDADLRASSWWASKLRGCSGVFR